MVKKLFSLICAFILTGTSGFAADVSRLYTVKNAKAAEVEKVLTPYLKRNFPSALKGQNSYILEDKNKKYYYVVILADKTKTVISITCQITRMKACAKSLLKL